MSIINIEFDNNLSKSNIEMSLLSSSAAEAGSEYSNEYTDKAQTMVFGIQVPLIMINSTIIDFDAVQQFILKSEGVTPELSMIVEDRYKLIENIDKPRHDNEVRVQIIPKFDNAYKKIDLTFYISNIKVNGSLISLNCIYKLPSLFASRFKTFGKSDTYTLFKTIANETKLGFATNIAALSDDRFVYCDNKSYLDLMNSEIQFANYNDHILDWWIDLWDNINLADIKERFESIDSDDDMMIWVAGNVNEINIDNEIKPIQTVATMYYHPAFANSELAVKSYNILNKSGIFISTGSDKVYSIYESDKGEYTDYLLQNGDIKNDIFTKYEYLGENFGEYNYLLAKHVRERYIQKIKSEQIKITLQSPLIGLMRGHKVNFIKYINDDKVENKMKALEKENMINRDVASNIPLADYEITSESDDGKFIIDKTVSGQYLITAVNIVYKNNTWDYELILARPSLSQPNILNNE